MLRIRTFGGLSVTGPAAPPAGAANQRRPLALLALLAGAGEQGVARDRLHLLLWPESDTRRARNNLNQTLYALRRDLGADELVLGTAALRLNPAVVSCDLWEFEAALDAGNGEEAVAVYGGPFLDGFALSESPEFERWAADERHRLGRRHWDALEVLARWAAEQGHHRLALERWRELAGLAPLSGRAAAGLVRALDDAGDRTGALEAARAHAERVRAELGTEPDPEVVELADRLRTGPRKSGAASAPAISAASPAAPARAAGPSRFRSVAIVAAVLAVAAALALGFRQRPGSAASSAGDAAAVAVLPFAVRGGADAQYLGPAMAELLTAGLDGAGELRGIDPRAVAGWAGRRPSPVVEPSEGAVAAERFGAELYVLGEVVEAGGRVRARATLYRRDRPAAPEAQASAEAGAGDLFALVDRLVAGLVAGRGGPDRLTQVAATSTGSLPALKAYLAGAAALEAGRYAEAVAGYARAVELDSTFALAHYRLAIAAELAGRDGLADAATSAARRHAVRLSAHDRQLLEAHAAWRAGEHAAAERGYRAIVEEYPEDQEAWFQLGELLFHTGPLHGRSAVESREAFEQVLALDPNDEEALVHLARVAFLEGRMGEVDTLVRRVLALAPSAEVLELRAFRAFALSDREGHKRATRELLRRPSQVAGVTALQVAVRLDDLEGTARFAAALAEAGRPGDIRALGHRMLARVALARGSWDAARAQLDSVERWEPTSALELRSLFASLPFVAVPRGELAAIRDRVRDWHAGPGAPHERAHTDAHLGLHPLVRFHRLGLLETRLGGTEAALAAADSLERLGGARGDSLEARDGGTSRSAARALAASVRAHVAAARGDSARALALLDQAGWPRVASRFEAEAADRFLRARLLEAAGREEEALAWYGTIAQRAAYELVYLAPARRRRAEILARKNRVGAVAANRQLEGRPLKDAMR